MYNKIQFYCTFSESSTFSESEKVELKKSNLKTF